MKHRRPVLFFLNLVDLDCAAVSTPMQNSARFTASEDKIRASRVGKMDIPHRQ